jgi:spore germination protein GerM
LPGVLTNRLLRIIIPKCKYLIKGDAMDAKYEVGQRVIIKPVGGQPVSKRENDIDTYAGQVGEVSDYYWISPRTGQIFYIYNVRVASNRKEVVVYEDELEPCLS